MRTHLVVGENEKQRNAKRINEKRRNEKVNNGQKLIYINSDLCIL